VRAGLRMLEREERQYQAKLSAIQTATKEAEVLHSGVDSPATHFSKAREVGHPTT